MAANLSPLHPTQLSTAEQKPAGGAEQYQASLWRGRRARRAASASAEMTGFRSRGGHRVQKALTISPVSGPEAATAFQPQAIVPLANHRGSSRLPASCSMWDGPGAAACGSRLTPASVALFRASGDTPEKTGMPG
jgi:hypothetical protein